MTSLPISSNKPQPSGNAANALQANAATDNLLVDGQSAESFAILLARQIGETDLSALTVALTASTIDGNAAEGSLDPALKNAQDQTTSVTNTPNDPANTLAAILLQLPVSEGRMQLPVSEGRMQLPVSEGRMQLPVSEDRMQLPVSEGGMQLPVSEGRMQLPVSEGRMQLPVSEGKMQLPISEGKMQLSVSESRMQLPVSEDRMQKSDGKQTTQLIVLGSSQEAKYKKTTAASETSQTIQVPTIDLLPSEAVKYAELPSGLTQLVQNTAQPIVLQPMPAAMPGILTNNTGTPPAIATPLGNNGWADEFSQKINWISTQQNQVAELHLNPPNLGPLDVVLKISDNQATALFTSPHAIVREAVENALPKLREVLADNGIMLGNATVSDQSPRDRNSDGFMNHGSGTAVQPEVSGTATELAGLLPAAAPVRRHNGMVDTFA